ncbi:Mitochondrial distribution and morphology 38 [Gossypium australe]|uniref:Mitochondrial distribution and morphology 38 n=1 Tax=Gossypium australe TaxID=47621 RepID=A0A5B6X694_9ROSI|nr:Mitochondrial distribution and morphology 38 [Gossypium australe]
MASHLFLQLPHFSYYTQTFRSSYGWDWKPSSSTFHCSNFHPRLRGSHFTAKKSNLLGLWFAGYTSSKAIFLGALSSVSSSPPCDPSDTGNEALLPEADSPATEFNRVNCLLWVLHESARSFSLAVESLELDGTSAELAMAWNGKDVHQWHKRIAHQVAVYAMLRTVIEVEILLSQERHNNPSPVRKILTTETDSLEEFIESRLKLRHPELVEWFRVVELPRMAEFFNPLLKKWSTEYAGSGVAGIIVAISCCAAVEKLCSEHISCPLSKILVGDAIAELMDLSHGIVSVDKLHKLATEAGFETHFLSHFGAKVLSGKKSDDLEFWIGLAQRKLSVAFTKETTIPGKLAFNSKVQADSLATLGLFAYLGRQTRLFLSQLRINDLDELVKDFLSYLECGILFIYPEFSSISVYQFFIEVVTDEIGWLDFYDTISCIRYSEKGRSKQHTIQAEKEIILSQVFTVCYDVFSGFAHFSRSAQQPLDSQLLAFLLQSQKLLCICLEDYWAAYDRSGEPLKITHSSDSKDGPSTGAIGSGTTRFSEVLEALTTEEPQIDEFRHLSLMKRLQLFSSAGKDTVSFEEGTGISKSSSLNESLIRKYCIKLIASSRDVCLGTQLLFVDITVSLELLAKQLCGQKVTAREKRKLKRTLNDIATLIPVTILMLLPVSAVGHAAMLAAINKYIPSLIPSPYSSERLDTAKQLKRTKKMDVISWSNLQDPNSKTP